MTHYLYQVAINNLSYYDHIYPITIVQLGPLLPPIYEITEVVAPYY
jgi:hypothetical protein